ncbi:MAG TPA: DNA internalization-related competence protein ComEC/Rec2, partial [Deinococcales bacterium]|nr:DNA internalization-related competence protein ComEC/Rec2 [Deinococcales bacterium]
SLLVALLFLPAGVLRMGVVDAAPDGFAGLDGSKVTVTGDFDGRFLHSPRGRLVLSLGGERLPPGRYRVQGELAPVTAARNPGTFDYAGWLRLHGVTHRLRPERRERLPDEGWLARTRAYLRSGLTSKLPAGPAALMTGIALGDTTALYSLPEAAPGLPWRDAFSRAGLAHVLALSGQQVSLLVLSLGLLARRLGRLRYPSLAAFLVLYVLVVGASPSVSRAALMGGCVLLALWLGRGRPEPLPLLALSAIPALLAEPRWLLDAGFQLSYGAVLGLIVLLPPLERATRPLLRAARWVVLAFGTTLAAQAFTLPLSASGFSMVPLASPLANLIAGPVVALLVPLGFLTAVTGPAVAGVLNLLVAPLASLLLLTARVFADLPALPWGTVGPPGWLAYLAAVTALTLWAYGHLRAWRALLVLLAAILATGIPGRRGAHEVIVLDVGQGDSILLRLGGGNVLVDGGGSVNSDYDVGERTVLPALRALGVRSLRAVIATHADTDHIEGLRAVLEHLRVGAVLVGHGKAPGDDRAWDALARAARARKVPLQPVRAGQQWRLGDATLSFLAPAHQPRREDNENSIATRVSYGRRAALLLGDMSSALEDDLHPGPVDLLVAAHHGSRHSTGATLLRRARPRVAAISVGRNRFGHPAREVLDRLTASKARVYRTDRDGAIRYDLATGNVGTVRALPEAGTPGPPGDRRQAARPQAQTSP